MLKVRDLMVENVITTKEETTIEDAVRVLFEKRVGALVITDDERKCKGIFTERDVLRSIARKIPLNTQIKSVMSKKVITIRVDASFAEAKSLMISNSIRHLPVVDKEGHLMGILTLRKIFDEIVGIPAVKG